MERLETMQSYFPQPSFFFHTKTTKRMIKTTSKLPNVGTSIFAIMSGLSRAHNAINLAQGYPNFDCAPALKDLVCEAIQNGHNQYAPMGGLPELTEQIAIKTEFLYGKSVDAATEITVTSGATQAIYTAIEAFVRAGDEVILIEPAYDSYSPAVQMCGGVVVPYRLMLPDFRIDWAVFAELITPKTRMIIINTPHNPTGMTLTKADWESLSALVKDTNIILLSDEVYEHIIFDGMTHQSILRFPELWERTIAISSFGKTFHTTGWKMGYCIAPPQLMNIFRTIHQFTVFSVNMPIQVALSVFLQEKENYLSLPLFYERKRDLFQHIMAATNFEAIPIQGTYFQLFKYSKISKENDVEFAKRMTTTFGVAAIPISVFYTNPPEEGIIRLCFAKTEETLEAAGKRLTLI